MGGGVASTPPPLYARGLRPPRHSYHHSVFFLLFFFLIHYLCIAVCGVAENKALFLTIAFFLKVISRVEIGYRLPPPTVS